jgi:hypothetical protein
MSRRPERRAEQAGEAGAQKGKGPGAVTTARNTDEFGARWALLERLGLVMPWDILKAGVRLVILNSSTAFVNRLFPNSLDVIERVRQWGPAVLRGVSELPAHSGAKAQRAGALHDASALSDVPENAKRLGVR